MSRISPKVIGVLVSALAVTGLATGPANAAQGAVDGTITAEGQACSWTDGVTSDTSPNTLTVDNDTINQPGGNLSCAGDTTAVLNNDPTVTFDDTNGTATVDLLDVSVTMLGVTCRYQASDVSAQRDGDTRTYTATADIPLYQGGWLCPDPASVNATFSFR
ncbi:MULTISPECIES: hypothetical protein [unclassified Streptomyces]|uniref:hypothetical protein n=1 Tax=unclassified Streptomyces TaxID=2593676 RepID=UPI0022B62220|nr:MULTISPECIES: hypothetical protein [unclassified Streptomyces]MCZ7417314.1 hypothetical protein [Streptomyces sp. WMMC897]MCZ7432859.1 hypothetical protein [Streptomyces sp. WMMC1477]